LEVDRARASRPGPQGFSGRAYRLPVEARAAAL